MQRGRYTDEPLLKARYVEGIPPVSSYIEGPVPRLRYVEQPSGLVFSPALSESLGMSGFESAEEFWPRYSKFWDDYKLEEQLGAGAFGAVWLASRGGQQYAVKIFTRKPENETEIIVLKELSKDCDWFIRYYGTYTIRDPLSWEWRAALLMEYVPGKSLQQYLDQKQRLTDAELSEITQQLLRQLACMHGAGLAHRDIKPDNIMVNTETKPLRALLLDYGLVCRLENHYKRRGEYSEVPLCATKLQADKLYLPPDIPLVQDEKSDMWALGLTLWYLRHPETQPKISKQQLDRMTVPKAVEMSRQTAEQIQSSPSRDALDDLIKTMVEVDPARRPNALQALKSMV